MIYIERHLLLESRLRRETSSVSRRVRGEGAHNLFDGHRQQRIYREGHACTSMLILLRRPSSLCGLLSHPYKDEGDPSIQSFFFP